MAYTDVYDLVSGHVDMGGWIDLALDRRSDLFKFYVLVHVKEVRRPSGRSPRITGIPHQRPYTLKYRFLRCRSQLASHCILTGSTSRSRLVFVEALEYQSNKMPGSYELRGNTKVEKRQNTIRLATPKVKSNWERKTFRWKRVPHAGTHTVVTHTNLPSHQSSEGAFPSSL